MVTLRQVAAGVDEEGGDAAADVLVGLELAVGVVSEAGKPRRGIGDGLEEGAGGVIGHGPEAAGAILHGLEQSDLVGVGCGVEVSQAVGLSLDPAAGGGDDQAVIGACGGV